MYIRLSGPLKFASHLHCRFRWGGIEIYTLRNGLIELRVNALFGDSSIHTPSIQFPGDVWIFDVFSEDIKIRGVDRP